VDVGEVVVEAVHVLGRVGVRVVFALLLNELVKLDERVRPRNRDHDVAPVAAIVAAELVDEAGVDLLEIQERQALGEAAVRQREVAHALLY
jgi:hypothetical protein